MSALQIYQVDAFTNRLFGGNPAAVVVFEAYPAGELLQHIASENNLSETAYLVRVNAGVYQIRWFTPSKEVRLCGHATLAAAHVLFSTDEKTATALSFQTKAAGTLHVERVGDQLYTMNFPADVPKEEAVSEAVASALGQRPQALFSGLDDLLAILPSEAKLRQLTPDSNLLKTFPHRGVIVSAPGDKVDFVSRCFYPNYGIEEDPVTGSAHTLMTPYWVGRLGKNPLTAQQISPRIGDIKCRLEGDRVFLTGGCVTYLVGELLL
ncbi:MAG: PhzF family phenazine biosynthesis protein [Bacteroidota bacterium]